MRCPFCKEAIVTKHPSLQIQRRCASLLPTPQQTRQQTVQLINQNNTQGQNNNTEEQSNSHTHQWQHPTPNLRPLLNRLSRQHSKHKTRPRNHPHKLYSTKRTIPKFHILLQSHKQKKSIIHIRWSQRSIPNIFKHWEQDHKQGRHTYSSTYRTRQTIIYSTNSNIFWNVFTFQNIRSIFFGGVLKKYTM